MTMFELNAGDITLSDLRRIYTNHTPICLNADAANLIEKSRAAVDAAIANERVVYGINTGFGKLAGQRIDSARLEQLQENLILSHCTGTGPILDDRITRLIILLKINALAQGYSGIRMDLIKALMALFNNEIYPRIPAKGSVGASGDLAPLAHMSAVLLGHGAVSAKGKIMPATQGLEMAGLKPMRLAPKEGLALINGTQASTALALAGLFAIENCFAAALVAGALSVDAAKGSATPFRPEIHTLRRQPGQQDSAKIYRTLLNGSSINQSHTACGKVQDPYCLRCMPQVMGACLDTIRAAAAMLAREANAVTDNPLVLTQSGDIVSGGNFHAEPVAFAADMLATAIAEIGSMSERRIAMLIDSNQSGLPPFLVADAGINSGFMIAHVTAAALVSENKQMSFPAVVDSIPTSAGQEDHVSMATHGARRVIDMAENAATIVGIELLAAAQGVEFHRPLQSSPALEHAITAIRTRAAHYDADRFFAPDIEAIKDMVASGNFLPHGEKILPSCVDV